MKQRGVSQLQINMSLIIIKITVLSALIGLVVTAAINQRPTCREEIPSELIRELWNRTKILNNRLPREDRFSPRVRLLPKFCTSCPTNTIGWLEIQEVTDVFEKSVFSSKAIQKLLPHHYNDLLHRLHHTLQHCISSTKPSSHFKEIKKMERKIQKKGNEAALKAVTEFSYVLSWIDDLL